MKSQVALDFKKSRIIWLILCIGMLPMIAGGYSMYILGLLLPFILINRVKITTTSIQILCFSLCYFLVQFFTIKGNYASSSIIFDLFFPIIMYQTGTLVVRRSKSPTSCVVLCVLMAFCLAIPAIYSNIIDTIQTGKLINVSRSIIEDSKDSFHRAATGYGMMLSILNGCLGVLILKASSKIETKLKIAIIIFVIGALFSTIHLLNRTGIVLATASIFIILLIPPVSIKRLFYAVFSLVLIVGVVIAFADNSVFLSDAVEMYEARDAGSGSVSSYGGRSDLWIAGLNQLISNPIGNASGLIFNGRHRYAHNMWIDAGIKGGIVCFILLICVTYKLISSECFMLKRNYLSYFQKAIMILIGCTIILQASVEPVIEGLPQFFYYIIFFTSVIQNLNHKYKHTCINP